MNLQKLKEQGVSACKSYHYAQRHPCYSPYRVAHQSFFFYQEKIVQLQKHTYCTQHSDTETKIERPYSQVVKLRSSHIMYRIFLSFKNFAENNYSVGFIVQCLKCWILRNKFFPFHHNFVLTPQGRTRTNGVSTEKQRDEREREKEREKDRDQLRGHRVSNNNFIIFFFKIHPLKLRL